MKLSVAMCTYNGAAYLAEQLQSIAAQDRLPDELVVCDDCSTDDSAAVVRAFAARAPFAVRLEVNRTRLGARANFAQAIGLCRGRWIALADQDDVWRGQKLRRLTDALHAAPEAGLAFSDAEVVDHDRRPLGYGLWEAVRFSGRQQRCWQRGRSVDVLLKHNVVSGATMVFRAADRDLLLPIPDGWVHDGWIALLLAAVAPSVAIAEPLIQYRQHPLQQIGQRRLTFYAQYLRGREQDRGYFQQIAANYAAARDRLVRFRDRLSDPRVLEALERKVEHFQAKVVMREGSMHRLLLVVREALCGHYARYSSGWRSLAQDLFLSSSSPHCNST